MTRKDLGQVSVGRSQLPKIALRGPVVPTSLPSAAGVYTSVGRSGLHTPLRGEW